jgi:hypothetical protein
MIIGILALGLSIPKGVCHNPHLLTRSILADRPVI